MSATTNTTTDPGNYYIYFNTGYRYPSAEELRRLQPQAYEFANATQQYRRWQQQQTAHERQAAREHEKEAQEAQKRAEVLLLSVLDARQAEQWATTHEVDVVGSEGHNYRLTRARQGGVFRLGSRNRRTHSLCIHHDYAIPIEDQIAAQKLQIETDEAEFCRIANESPVLA
jgi:hypothetical protein